MNSRSLFTLAALSIAVLVPAEVVRAASKPRVLASASVTPQHALQGPRYEPGVLAVDDPSERRMEWRSSCHHGCRDARRCSHGRDDRHGFGTTVVIQTGPVVVSIGSGGPARSSCAPPPQCGNHVATPWGYAGPSRLSSPYRLVSREATALVDASGRVIIRRVR